MSSETWLPGRHARLVGLVGRSQLNGVEVVLLRLISSSSRWATRCVVSDERLSVKDSNLEASASLMEMLSTDDIQNILLHLPLPDLTAMFCVCHSLAERAKFVARSADWQLCRASLLELVQGGAPASVIRDKFHSQVSDSVDAGEGVVTDELMEAGRFLVQSGAPAESLSALWELPSKHSWMMPYYLRDLCALQMEGDEVGFDEDGMNLLHHACTCGAGPAVTNMILCASPDTMFITDHGGFLPIHHAAIRGASTRVMRTLLQHPHTDVIDVYESPGESGSLLHLALQGGSGSWDMQCDKDEPPLSASQNAVALLLLRELHTLAPPLETWDDFVPPAQEPLICPTWNPSKRYPLHLAAVAGASEPLLAALIAAHPPAARLRDAMSHSIDLVQPCGYLPAHYALGAARTGPYSTCRACGAEAQATLLAAYPLAEWPLVDLIRAGPTALADPNIEERAVTKISSEAAVGCAEADMTVAVDDLLHLAVAHAAPPPILAALISRRPEQLSSLSKGWVRVLPLHLARTAAAVRLLLMSYPSGAHQKSECKKEPNCEPLTYALRNRAPDEVARALAAHDQEQADRDKAPAEPTSVPVDWNEDLSVADREDELLPLPRRKPLDLDAFGNGVRALGMTHARARKCSGVDMRKVYKGLDKRAEGLRRLFGGEHAAEEGASPLLLSIVEEGDVETVQLLLLEAGGDVNQGCRPWGCECSKSGGCARCVGRRLPGGWTPLHEACCQGRADLVRLLLEAGADARCATAVHKQGGGTTPLAVALDRENEACVLLLQSHLEGEAA